MQCLNSFVNLVQLYLWYIPLDNQMRCYWLMWCSIAKRNHQMQYYHLLHYSVMPVGQMLKSDFRYFELYPLEYYYQQ